MEKQSPDNTRRTARVIAFYLPQYHPTPENDRWWGKGFTEWTNVGKARPLFRGHYQPRVPADLGYYDLRVPETRQEQADMARQYGVEGFCYWHYWFGNGRRLLQRPFQEVLASGKPDFPFCLAWANHTWEDKQFSKEGTHRVLMEQLYPGDADYEAHFRALLPTFRDPRYICVDGKPLFMVYNPHELPDAPHFIGLWQRMAQAEGLPGIHFVGQTDHASEIDRLRSLGFDAVNVVRLFDFFRKDFSLPEKVYMKLMRVVFGRGRVVDYARAARFFTGDEDRREDCYPTLIPNWDHSPRSGRKGHILVHSTPAKFRTHVTASLRNLADKPEEHRIVFLKSWNEWAEGNYMEPDLRFGRGYLEALQEALETCRS